MCVYFSAKILIFDDTGIMLGRVFSLSSSFLMICAIKEHLSTLFYVMMKCIKGILLLFVLTLCSLGAISQERKVMNRPFLDDRKLHYGFLVGFHMQDLELLNTGYRNPETGEQWYADIDNYNPGFTVGVIGEMRLNKYFALRLTPTIHFGQKHVVFREQITGRDSTQNLKSAYISIPINVKFAAPRYNNFRPYLTAGVSPTLDLTAGKHGALRVKPFDCYAEFGMGCDIYLRFFKLNPELKFCIGMLDVLKHKRADLIDPTLNKYTDAVEAAHSKLIVLAFNFE